METGYPPGLAVLVHGGSLSPGATSSWHPSDAIYLVGSSSSLRHRPEVDQKSEDGLGTGAFRFPGAGNDVGIGKGKFVIVSGEV